MYLAGIKNENIEKISWVCDPCLNEFTLARQLKQDLMELKEVVHQGFQAIKGEMKEKLKVVKEEVAVVGVAVESVTADAGIGVADSPIDTGG